MKEEHLDTNIYILAFTYCLGSIAIEAKAKTSPERAKKFNEEIQKIL